MNAPAHTDEIYFHAAARELYGDAFVVTELTSPESLSKIAQRAAELKHEDEASTKPAAVLAVIHPLARLEFGVFLAYLAKVLYEARLSDGRKLQDVMDFKQWLEELAEEAKR